MRHEVIVVNDSGSPLKEEEWLKSVHVKIIQTNRRERCVARNAGAAIAKGRYLHFLDDDDWMLQGAFEKFWAISQQSDASWIFGGYRFVDSADNFIEDGNPDEQGNCFIRFLSGEWLPLQGSIILSNVFHRVGGFFPLGTLLGGDEDVDLARRISLTETIDGVSEPVVAIRFGRDSTTTNYSNLRAQSLQSRELILSRQQALQRMRTSAAGRSDQCYWLGRIVWIYLISALWKLRKKMPIIAIGRIFSGLGSLLLSYPCWVTTDFWRGALKPHRPKGWLVRK